MLVPDRGDPTTKIGLFTKRCSGTCICGSKSWPDACIPSVEVDISFSSSLFGRHQPGLVPAVHDQVERQPAIDGHRLILMPDKILHLALGRYRSAEGSDRTFLAERLLQHFVK